MPTLSQVYHFFELENAITITVNQVSKVLLIRYRLISLIPFRQYLI